MTHKYNPRKADVDKKDAINSFHLTRKHLGLEIGKQYFQKRDQNRTRLEADTTKTKRWRHA